MMLDGRTSPPHVLQFTTTSRSSTTASGCTRPSDTEPRRKPTRRRRDRHEDFSTTYESPPPHPLLHGGSAPGTPRCARASQGSAPRGSPVGTHVALRSACRSKSGVHRIGGGSVRLYSTESALALLTQQVQLRTILDLSIRVKWRAKRVSPGLLEPPKDKLRHEVALAEISFLSTEPTLCVGSRH